MAIRAWLKRFFAQSAHVHVREDVAATPSDLIDLMDRFVDGPMRYPLEWDDFISWEQPDPDVEAVRQEISKREKWLFSGDRSQMHAYAFRVAEERNRLAALIDRPQRDLPTLSACELALLGGR